MFHSHAAEDLDSVDLIMDPGEKWEDISSSLVRKRKTQQKPRDVAAGEGSSNPFSQPSSFPSSRPKLHVSKGAGEFFKIFRL